MSKVVVIFGGNCSESKVSTASAQHFSEVLPQALLWYWHESGQVYMVNGAELRSHANVFKEAFQPKLIEKSWRTVELALDFAKSENLILLIGLHGGDGENGWLQRECEHRKISFTGSGSRASELAMSKPLAKECARTRGVKVADQITFNKLDSEARKSLVAFQSLHQRIVLKPASEGSSAGLAFLETSKDVDDWLDKNADSKLHWLAEEMLIGREFTIGVMMHRGSLIVLPPSEVILERNARFDYDGKYLGVGNKEITPADLNPIDTAKVQETVLLAHSSLGCYGYTRSEVILTAKGPYYLETNTLPGFTKRSFIPQQLQAAGITVSDFIEGQLKLAIERYSS